MVAGGFARAVGAIGLVWVLLGKRRFVMAQRPVDLVCGYMQKPKRCLFAVRQGGPVTAHSFQQTEGSNNIVLYKGFRAVDRPVHMGLSGKIHNGTGLMIGQQLRNQGTIANVALHKDMPRVILHTGQVLQITRIAEYVQINDGVVAT